MKSVLARPRYSPSGRVDWLRLAWALPIATAWSGLVASFFCVLVARGYYPMALAVLLPASFSAGIAVRIVRATHCRNRVLAGVLTGAMGLAGYAAYLHADQVVRWDVPWTAIDRLPGFVAFRMETDGWQFLHKGALLRPLQPAAGVVPWRGLPGINFLSMNWGLLLFDVGVSLLVPLATAAYAAGQPYSESRRRWCDCEKLVLAPEAGTSLRAALAANQIDAWVQSRPRKVGEHEPHVTVSVWYTPRDPAADVDWDVFVAIDSGPRWRLAPAEAADLTVLLPALQDIAGPTAELLAAEAAHFADAAKIRPVPPPYAGLAQNRWTRLAGRTLIWSTMIGPGVLAMVALAGGTWLLTQFAGGPRPFVPGWFVPIYVVGVGLAALTLIGYWHNPERQMAIELGRQFDHWLMRRAIRQRPAPLVAADDPKAMFVEMSPRRLFQIGSAARDGDYNQGLLLCDWDRELLLFEGDYACYEIPAAAILECQIEGFPGVAGHTGGLFGVILQVQLGAGAIELPLFPLRNVARANRWEQAWALLEQIQRLTGREFTEQPTQPPPAPPLAVG